MQKFSDWTRRLDLLDHLAAFLDSEGGILYVNRAWTDFAVANDYRGPAFVGVSYLRVCATAERQQSHGAAHALRVIADVVSGKRNATRIKLPCHSPAEDRWFTSWARPMAARWSPITAMIGFRNTTRQHLAGVTARRSVRPADCNCHCCARNPGRSRSTGPVHCAAAASLPSSMTANARTRRMSYGIRRFHIRRVLSPHRSRVVVLRCTPVFDLIGLLLTPVTFVFALERVGDRHGFGERLPPR